MIIYRIKKLDITAKCQAGWDMQEENRIDQNLEAIIKEAIGRRASDIHLAQGTQVMFRIDGMLFRMSEEIIQPSKMETMLETMLNEEQSSELKRTGELEFTYSAAGYCRLRVNVFRQGGIYAAAIRLIPFQIPEPKELKIPDAVIDFCSRKMGLVLVTGEAGSGKTTTLSSLIGEIRKTYAKTILTLEDSTEYLHCHDKSMIFQREIGRDSRSYDHALRAAMRQDTDVIMIGELKDADTIRLAVNAAEMGHLVFSSFAANSVIAALDEMIELFPPHLQQQMRIRLSGVLEGMISERLLPRQDDKGRAAAFEVLSATPAVRNLVREGKTYQLISAMHGGRKDGMQTMDDAIYALYMKSEISSETAIFYAQDPDGMRRKVQLF